MTFDSSERSRQSFPHELYRFTLGATEWRFTSSLGAGFGYGIDSADYKQETIKRTEVDFSQEDIAGTIDIELPAANAVAALFVPYTPIAELAVTIYRQHAGGAFIPWHVGRVISASFAEPSFVVLRSQPISGSMQKKLGATHFQSQCNHVLYSARCGVAKADFKTSTTVASVSGRNVVSSDFATKPDGYFRNGWCELAGGERRFIVAHAGDTVTLMNAFIALAPGDAIDAFAGCDRTETECRTKFSNTLNHLGFGRIPSRNPFVGQAF